MLPRVADAAEDLDALLGDEALAVAGRGLGHRRGERPTVVVLRDGRRGEVAGRPGPLEGDEHVGELVLDRLERPDRHAELLARAWRSRARCRRSTGTCRPSRARARWWLPGARRSSAASGSHPARRGRGRRRPSRRRARRSRAAAGVERGCACRRSAVPPGRRTRRRRRRPGPRPRARRPCRRRARGARCPSSRQPPLGASGHDAEVGGGGAAGGARTRPARRCISPLATAPRKRACCSGVPTSRTRERTA